jgi:hypothetical protein
LDATRPSVAARVRVAWYLIVSRSRRRLDKLEHYFRRTRLTSSGPEPLRRIVSRG